MEQLDLDIVYKQVPHVQQKHKWDCGIASVLMVFLSTNLRKESALSHQGQLNAILEELRADPATNFKKRPWTIDLCNILHRLHVDFVLFTTATQVNDALSSLKFYSKLEKDRKRVDALLKDSNLQTFMRYASLSDVDLINELKFGPLILLVNANMLQCRLCRRRNETDWSTNLCFPQRPSFLGHYVVIIGYSISDCVFYYSNPSLQTNLCEIRAQDLNQARRCMGTDEDIIAVRLGGSISVEPSPVTSQHIATKDTMLR